jgi:hypothetical protein
MVSAVISILEKNKILGKENSSISTLSKNPLSLLFTELLFSLVNYNPGLFHLFASPLFYPVFFLLLSFNKGHEFILQCADYFIKISNNVNYIYSFLIAPVLNLIPFAMIETGGKGKDEIYFVQPEEFGLIL